MYMSGLIHPSIHHRLCRICSDGKVPGLLLPIPTILGVKMVSHPVLYRRSNTGDKQPSAFTPTDDLQLPVDNMHVFGLQEGAGGPGENPCMLRENVQTPHRKVRELNPGPYSCCEATQQCHIHSLSYQ